MANSERRVAHMVALALGLVVLAGCVVPAYAPPAPARTATTPGQEVVLAGGEGTEVVAEGKAALSAGGADIARDHALKDALRKAVEQGVGTFVSSESRVQNFQLLSDRIYSQASGYVSSYRVITEGQEGELYRVVVRARVKLERIEDDLSAIGILVAEQGRPRIMVVVKELDNLSDILVDDRMMSQEMIETMIVDAFQSRGFPVVDAATVRKNLEKEQLKKVLEGDLATAQLIGMKTGAEIVVAGTAQRSSTRKNIPYSGGTTEFFKVSLSVRAVNVATAEVVAASALTRELPFSADNARKEAADSVAAELIAKILRGWKKRVNITQISASNADFARAQKLKTEILAKVRGVTSVVQRDLTGSTALLEVVSESSSQEVLDDLVTRGLDIPFTV
ncbi:MAG: flagellar assembly protein T N-terminal domain-containing protein, partial [candidate division WOR-3 bacterium]